MIFRRKPTPLTGTANEIAHKYVPVSIGWGMAISQEANKVLRRCQIGMVREKPEHAAQRR